MNKRFVLIALTALIQFGSVACTGTTTAPTPASPTVVLTPTVVPTIPTARPSPTAAPSTPTTKPSPTAAPSTTVLTPTATPRVPSATGEMVLVPAGEFTMGSIDFKDERPEHAVYLDAFWIDKFEVTNALYKKCVDASKCQPQNESYSPTRSSDYGDSQYDNYPAIYVSWIDANTYCAWAGKRLPTEAEWEKAARGGDARTWPWSNTWDGTRLNSCDKRCSMSWSDRGADDGYADIAPVGNYLMGASPYGALDMAGNVWEWVADWYDPNYYSSSPRNNPKGPSSGEIRVLRGGSWYNSQQDTRVTVRGYGSLEFRGNIVGFRCAQ